MTVTAVPWRNDEPRLTRAEVERITFPPNPLTRRGYNTADVDRFAARVIRELEMLKTEKASLARAWDDLRERFIDHKPPGDIPASVPEAREMAVAAASAGQLAADRRLAAAKAEAERISADARGRWDALVAEAEKMEKLAARKVREADAYAERVRRDAEQQARTAAAAALDAPVTGDAEQAARAARASGAANSAYMNVSLLSIRAILDAAVRVVDDAQRRQDEGRTVPGQAAPAA